MPTAHAEVSNLSHSLCVCERESGPKDRYMLTRVPIGVNATLAPSSMSASALSSISSACRGHSRQPRTLTSMARQIWGLDMAGNYS